MLMAKQGEITSPGMPILQMINTQTVKMKADVPEVYIRDVRRNDFVRVKIPVLDYEKEVRVSRVGNVINSNNRTFEVEVKLDNPGNEIKPNLLAYLYINDYEAKDAVALPLDLIQQDVSGNNYVFVVRDSSETYMAEKRQIQTGVVFNGKMEVLEGLKGDEQLVTTGAQYLADGEQVLVKKD